MTNELSINDCYKLWKEANQKHLNPSTYHRYTNLMEKHLLTYFSDVKLCDITDTDINLFFENKEKDGMSEVAMHMLFMLLKKLLQLGGIDTVKLGLEHTIHIRNNKRIVEIMPREEWERLDIILNKSDELGYLSISLAFKMGMAVGEICALMWNEVDFATKTLSVRNMVQRVQNTAEHGKKTLLTKRSIANTAQRELPIPETVFKMLLQSRKSKGYVLECKEGKLPDPRREQLRLEKMFEKYGMREYNFHTLRDTFAVRCLKAGMNVEDLSYVLGHSSVTITAERYKEFLEMRQDRVVVLKRYMEMV